MKITIAGHIGEGRSTLAKYIEKCLTDVGIAVELDDEELTVEWHLHDDRRLEILRDREMVVGIKTLRLRAPVGLGYIGMPLDESE